MAGWWLTYPSEKYEFVSWDDELPNWMESHKSHVPNHQPDMIWWDFPIFSHEIKAMFQTTNQYY